MKVTERRKLKFNPRAKCYIICSDVDDYGLYDEETGNLICESFHYRLYIDNLTKPRYYNYVKSFIAEYYPQIPIHLIKTSYATHIPIACHNSSYYSMVLSYEEKMKHEHIRQIHFNNLVLM